MKATLIIGVVLVVTSVPRTNGKVLQLQNSISKSTEYGSGRTQCLTTDRSGIAPCDNDPICCLKESPRLPDSDYCCPPFTSQFQFKSVEGMICACSL